MTPHPPGKKKENIYSPSSSPCKASSSINWKGRGKCFINPQEENAYQFTILNMKHCSGAHYAFTWARVAHHVQMDAGYITHCNLKSWSKTLCECVNTFWIKVKGYEHVTKLQAWTESVQLCIRTIVKSKQTSGGRGVGGKFSQSAILPNQCVKTTFLFSRYILIKSSRDKFF